MAKQNGLAPAARERLIVNGHVLTCEGREPATAVAIRGSQIVWVGSEHEARSQVGRDAELLDAGGRTVLPGLVDAHTHYLSTAESLGCLSVRYPEVASADDLVARVAHVAQDLPSGRWIRAFGMDHTKFPASPTRWDLDSATIEHPVVVYHVSGHGALVNTCALAARSIRDSVSDPPGGAFDRDASGRLTGFCIDTATQLVVPVAVDIGCHGPNFHTDLPPDELIELLAGGREAYLEAGVTTVCDPQVTRRELTTYQRAHDEGSLGLRTSCMPLSHALDALATIGLSPRFGDDWLRLSGLKLYADGTLIGGTASFSEPYGRKGEHHGSMYWDDRELTAMVTRAHRLGWQVGIHAQGDRAVEASLRAIRSAAREWPREDARHRIEHCGYPTASQLREMGALGVIPVSQPSYLHDSGDELLETLGPRAHGLQPLRDEIELGLRPVLSSDAFIASHRPMDTIAAAVVRETREGRTIGEAHQLSLDEALRAHTIDAARSIGMEHKVGSLRAGKLADVVILDVDLRDVEPHALAGVGVRETILDGRTVWTRGGAGSDPA